MFVWLKSTLETGKRIKVILETTVIFSFCYLGGFFKPLLDRTVNMCQERREGERERGMGRNRDWGRKILVFNKWNQIIPVQSMFFVCLFVCLLDFLRDHSV